MTDIKTIEDARQAWDVFKKKYTNLVSIEEKNLYRNTPPSPAFIQRVSDKMEADENAAINIQRFFRGSRERDTFVRSHAIGLTPISEGARGPKSNNPTESATFSIIKKSVNRWKLMTLEEALNTGNWENSIFKDKTLPQLALSLFESGKITDQQLASVLEFNQATLEPNASKAIFRILDSEGNFTEDAKKNLIPRIQNPEHLKQLTKAQIEAFRLLVATQPTSEQVFYITQELPTTGFDLTDVLLMNENNIVHLSRGALDSLGIARYGTEEYVKQLFQFGRLEMRDIESGVKKQLRYGAIAYPGTGDLELIHNAMLNPLQATRHDDYHREMMSVTPKVFIIDAFQRLVNMIRQTTGMKWTKEIWDYVDANYIYFLEFNRTISPKVNLEDSEQMTRLFCHMLQYGFNNSEVMSGGSLIRKGELTYIGALTFIDMIKNPDIWRGFKIDPKKLILPFSSHFERVKEIFSIIQNDDAKIKILKCFIYNSLKDQGRENEFADLSETINANSQVFLSRITFEKLTKDIVDNQWTNVSFVALDGVPITRATIDEIIQNIRSNTPLPEEMQHNKAEFIYESAKMEQSRKRPQLKGAEPMDDNENALFEMQQTLMTKGFSDTHAFTIAQINQKYNVDCNTLTEYEWRYLINATRVLLYDNQNSIDLEKDKNLIIYFEPISELIKITGTSLQIVESINSKISFEQIPALINVIKNLGLSMHEIITLEKSHIEELFNHEAQISLLIKTGVTLSEIFGIDDNSRQTMYEHAIEISKRVLLGDSLADATKMFTLSPTSQKNNAPDFK